MGVLRGITARFQAVAEFVQGVWELPHALERMFAHSEWRELEETLDGMQFEDLSDYRYAAARQRELEAIIWPNGIPENRDFYSKPEEAKPGLVPA